MGQRERSVRTVERSARSEFLASASARSVPHAVTDSSLRDDTDRLPATQRRDAQRRHGAASLAEQDATSITSHDAAVHSITSQGDRRSGKRLRARFLKTAEDWRMKPNSSR